MSKNAVNILMCHRSGKSRGDLSNATLIIIVSPLLTCCDLSIFMRFINVYTRAPGSGYNSAGSTLEFFFLVSLGFTRSAVLHSFGYVTLEKIKFSSPFHQSYGWTINAIHTPQKWQVELWPHTNENRLVISICQSQGSRVAVNPAMINPEQWTFKLLFGFTAINSWWYHVQYFDQILLKFIQVHMHYM